MGLFLDLAILLQAGLLSLAWFLLVDSALFWPGLLCFTPASALVFMVWFCLIWAVLSSVLARG